MIDAIAAATRGLQTEERRFNGAARDVANVNTPGYKPAGGWSQRAQLATGRRRPGLARVRHSATRGDGLLHAVRRVPARCRWARDAGSGELGDPDRRGAGAGDVPHRGPRGERPAAVGRRLVSCGGRARPASARTAWRAGDGLLDETAESGPQASADGYIVRGGLEASGTDYASAQITAARSYTALASVFRTADEMQGSLLDMLA